MKRMLLSLASVATIALAAPAAAQYGNNNQSNASQSNTWSGSGSANIDYSDRIDQLEDRLEDGIDAGTIDRTKARSLRLQLRQLTRLESRYAQNGIDQQERRDLQQRIRAVRQDLRTADNRNESRYGNWDRWDREDGYTQNGGANGSQYGGRNNGPNSRYQEVGEVCSQRGTAVTAILRNILGSDNCLRVGERASTSLSALPSQYRSEFRDESGFYYRYLDGNVVQVDSRTNVVARIYDVG